MIPTYPYQKIEKKLHINISQDKRSQRKNGQKITVVEQHIKVEAYFINAKIPAFVQNESEEY